MTTDFLYSYEADAMVVDSPRFLWHLANFDGAHYQNIARFGYIVKFQTAFFPLYPLITNWLAQLTGNYLVAGLLISLIGTLIAGYLIYVLSRSSKALLALLAFPTAFFLITGYTESLFLALAIGAWTAATRKRYLLAGWLGALAAASRFYGLLLFPSLILKAYQQLPADKRLRALPLFLIPLGLVFYMAFLQLTYGDPLSFIHSLSLWNKSAVTFPLQTIYRYLKIFLTAQPTTFVFQIAILEFASLLAGLFFAVRLFFRRLLPESLYVFLGVLTPTFTGTLQSLPRYLLVLFPIYLLAANLPWRRLIPLLLVCLALQIYLFINFLSGRFVA